MPEQSQHLDSPADIPGIWSAFMAVLSRDLLITLRKRQQWLNPLIFFVIVITMFPLAVGPEAGILSLIAPGVIWVAALLATMLSLDMLFTADLADGTLEQLALSPQPLSVMVLAKVLAHWLVSGLPLVLLSPLLGLLLQLPSQAMWVLVFSLGLGTIALSLIGAIGAALTVSLRHAGLLLSVLVLPLYVPVLIFGSNAVASAVNGQPVEAQLSLLAAIALVCLALAPWATAAALRVGIAIE